MQRKLVRILALILCAVMLLGMIPAFASAAEAEEDTVEVTKVDLMNVDGQTQPVYSTYTKNPDEPIFVEEEPVSAFPAANSITQSGTYYYFETFQELQELAAGSDGSQIYAYYQGSGSLVISEDLTLPENMDLQIAEGKKLIVSKGVTFTTNYLHAYDFTVNGTWISNRFSNVYGLLTVNGSARLNGGVLYLRSGGTISGLENVTRRYDEQILYYWDVRTVADIEEAISAAKNTGDGLPHGINMWVNGTLTIDKSLTIPENMIECSIYRSDGTIIIPEGVTFTTNSPRMWLSTNVRAEGKFVNNGNIIFNSPATFDVTGTYSGKGKLQVYNQNGETSLSQIVTGLDLDAFLVQEYESWGSHWWEVLDPDYVTQLGTPKNLKWHKRVQWDSDGNAKLVDAVGSVAWTAVSPLNTDSYTEYCVTLYRNGEAYTQLWYGYGASYFEQTKYCSAEDLTLSLEDLPSGEYYFTVQARTDAAGYCSSDIATSGTWTYTKPDSRVKRPSTLSFSSMIVKWNTISGAERYQIQFLYSATKSGTPETAGWGWTYINTQELWSWVIAENGPGYYYFKVRSLSDDITVKRHSAWSELSPAFHYTGKAKPAAPTVKSDIDPATGKPQVYWDRVPGCNKYRIYRATSKDGTYKSVQLLDTGTSMYGQYGWEDDTAKAGTKYYYKVRAYSYTDVVSSYSNTVTRRCDLARPTVTLTVNATTGKPVVKWKTVSGAEKYYIYRATSKTGDYERVSTAVSARSYEDSAAKAGKTYYYKVKAIHENTDANSAYSAIKSRMCDLKRPNVTIQLTSAGNPYLKWSEISGAEKYYVYRATSKSGSYTRIGTATEGKYVDKDVTEGKTYYYKVKAIHAKSGANSAYSAIDYITAE